jgi:hypothetical protein
MRQASCLMKKFEGCHVVYIFQRSRLCCCHILEYMLFPRQGWDREEGLMGPCGLLAIMDFGQVLLVQKVEG